jgi:hypothetical protein
MSNSAISLQNEFAFNSGAEGKSAEQPSNLPSPSTGGAIRAVEPDHLFLRPRKMRSGQRCSYLALEPNPCAGTSAYHQRIHRDQSNLIPLDPEAFILTALELLSSDRYLQKGNKCSAVLSAQSSVWGLVHVR